jgi:HPr kinase/phosphorylase
MVKKAKKPAAKTPAPKGVAVKPELPVPAGDTPGSLRIQGTEVHPTIAVSVFLSELKHELKLQVFAGDKGMANRILSPRIQKPGLAFAGYPEYIHAGRVQVLGKSEITFLNNLSEGQLEQVLQTILANQLSCIVITRGLEPPPVLKALCGKTVTPLLGSALMSSQVIYKITDFLEARLAPTVKVHGTLVDCYGLGVLLQGHSGMGKSECALDLIERGHRLVADDRVEITRRGFELAGRAPEISRHYMEIRGLGILNIKDLFGVAAVRPMKNVELLISLVSWSERMEVDRLGLEDIQVDVLGMKIPHLVVPVAPGRNLANLVEVAARLTLSKMKGYHPAQELMNKLDEARAVKRAEK